MSWWGKALGGAFGFALGGPLGALVGVAVGHTLDRGLKTLPEPDAGTWSDPGGPAAPDFGPPAFSHERTQAAFFTATFSVMGHLAKADGRVSEAEIGIARSLMSHMGLSPAQMSAARQLFNEGKKPQFDLTGVLTQFRRECHRSRNLIRMFVEIQLQAAYADGAVHAAERRVLATVCEHLGISEFELARLERMVRVAMRAGGGRGAPTRTSVDEALAVLGLTRDASAAEVKRAYRRLMSQHHPDKLVSKGLPEEMMQLATRRTQEIKAAYQTVKEARGL